MDNLDDSENHVKVSDSAYSNSCSNSQSRRRYVISLVFEIFEMMW